MFDLQHNLGLNESERLLTGLCRRSFLRLWAHTNLFTDEGKREGKSSAKELCDALVVFGDDVLIFSDKHIEFQRHKELSVAWPRWYRRAVKESISQLWGGKSWLSRFPQRVFLDAACTRGLPITVPDSTRARYHLIAVTRGTRDAARAHFGDEIGSLIVATDAEGDQILLMPFTLGRTDSSRGFIHVFDEAALEIVMDELDTISDFLGYLTHRAQLLGNPEMRVIATGEEQLVAAYLTTMDDAGEHCFVRFDGPAPPGMIMFDASHYEGLRRNPSYIAKKRADRISYFWDELIDRFITHGDPNLEPGGGAPARLEEVERALRYMAGESRFRRRILGRLTTDAMRAAQGGAGMTRLYGDPDLPDPAYVISILAKADDETYDQYRQHRRARLGLYCQVAKLKLPASNVFVGIAFDHPNKTYAGSSEDMLVWEQYNWNDDLQREAERLRAEFDVFGEGHIVQAVSVDEFPDMKDRRRQAPKIEAMFPGLGIQTRSRGGNRPSEKKKRDKVKAKSQRRNRKNR